MFDVKQTRVLASHTFNKPLIHVNMIYSTISSGEQMLKLGLSSSQLLEDELCERHINYHCEMANSN